ncbi:MAG: hypothetical protein PVG76_12260 [Chromatiales bacterium]|jgi:hypothetical protein
MSKAKGPGNRGPLRPQLDEDAEVWEYYNPALALVDSPDYLRTTDSEETATAREAGKQRGDIDAWEN